MPFDPKDKEQKKKLFPVLKALADLEPGKTPELILYDALGQTIPHGADYVSTMRKGEIKATYAQITYDWLITHHFDIAHRFAPDIFPETVDVQWRKLVQTRAEEGPLRLVLVKSGFGLVERDSKLETVGQTILLGQRFCLELDAEDDGYVIVMQGVGNLWGAIDLGENGVPVTKVTTGTNRLPQGSDGRVDPISENTYEGVHDFVAVVAKSDALPNEISKLVGWMNENECKISTTRVRVRT